MTTTSGAADARTIRTIIIAGSITVALAFGARSVFGVLMEPISTDLGWPRETFALSLALQNIVWGLGQPVFGMIADRYGDRLALWIGFGLYIVGMLTSAFAMTPMMQHLGAGLFVGLGVSGTAFGLVLSVVGRVTPEEKRSQALGVTAALGAGGQVLMPVICQWLEARYGWSVAILAITLMLAPMILCIPYLKAPRQSGTQPTPEKFRVVIARAFGHSSYTLLVIGFFVCGFHVAFISAHFPAYVTEVCGSAALGAATISIIGAANVVGTLAAGQLGAWFPKKNVLASIYALRAVVILVFLMIPPTPFTVVVFSMSIGVLWLSTVPMTAGLVATMFGPTHMATLYGFVFLSHQIGSFAGVWMGGRFYDLYGDYDYVWYVGIALGVFSALVHLPIREKPYEALAPA